MLWMISAGVLGPQLGSKALAVIPGAIKVSDFHEDTRKLSLGDALT